MTLTEPDEHPLCAQLLAVGKGRSCSQLINPCSLTHGDSFKRFTQTGSPKQIAPEVKHLSGGADGLL
jgi:hypothetical protein